MSLADKQTDLITLTAGGLYCKAGDFMIDPWEETERALITHAHADHARPVANTFFAADSSTPLLRHRLGPDRDIRGVPFGDQITFNDVTVSFHPAGHVLGSAQIRVQRHDDIWVFTGDFKRQADPTAEPFEVVPCNTLITEATFALPVYQWRECAQIAADIYQWWEDMRAADRPAILFAYSLGKAQRILAELTRFTTKTVYLHGAVANLTDIYREQGIHMLPSRRIDLNDKGKCYRGELIIAPPGASGSTWMRRFKDASTGFCSGWMQVRGNRRRRGYDRGFVISDHADWNGLLDTIEQTGATRVLATHGDSSALVRLLRDRGLQADELDTRFEAESETEPADKKISATGQPD